MDEEKSGPDSSESQAIDSFFLAVGAGNDEGVAVALRKAGKLSGFPLSFFAEILDPATANGRHPWRIGFSKPKRGRPKTPNSKLSTFLHYLSIKAAGKAAKTLRSRKKISGSELKILADLFDQNVPLLPGFSFRLKLVSNRKGRPVHKLKKATNDHYWRRVFTAEFKKQPKSVREVTWQVFKRLQTENEKLLAAKRKPNPLPSHSTIRNNLERLGFLRKTKQK